VEGYYTKISEVAYTVIKLT